MDSIVRPVLRDYTGLVLSLQGCPVTAAAIAEVLGVADVHQVRRVLQQLEQSGAARRERGGGVPGGGRAADRWTAVTERS